MRSCTSCMATVWEGARRCRACGAELPSVPEPQDAVSALLGRRLAGKFVLRELIGAGASGFVFRADQVTLGRTVAVKVLRPHLSGDPEIVRRFHHEAMAASRLNHPNVLSVIDYGQTEDGHLYIVMEHLRGRTLSQLLSNEFPVPVARAVGLVCQVLDALEEAHAGGVIHADLKSDNVVVETMRGGGDLVKVVDFGIARMVDARPGEALGKEPQSTNPGSRTICGTPEYMAPEVITGGETTPAADQYAAGVVLYELLTGITPFTGGTTLDVLSRHVREPVPPVADKRPGLVLPRPVEQALLRALAKQPGKRFPDVASMRAALLAAIADGSAAGAARAPARPSVPPAPATAADATRLCPSCGAENPTRFKFCPECGERWETTSAQRANPLLALAPTAHDVGATLRWTPPWVSSFDMPFVGRDAEQAEVAAFLGGAGAASTLVLSGPPGSGRSWLAREACEAVAAAGAFVMIAGADPTGLASPWYPVRATVAGILELPPVCDEATLAERLAAVGLSAREVPGLLELFAQPGPLAQLEPVVRRREATGAALHVLRAAASRGARAVLVFEDADRYDRMSLDLLARLVEHPVDTTVRVLVTTAPEAAAAWPASAARLALGALPATALEALAAALAEADPKASVPDVAELARLAQGRPLHVEQVLRFCHEGGELAHAPEGLADLVTARADHLPAHARIVLQAVAAAGEEVLRPVLARVADARAIEADELATALAQLEAQRMLVVDGELVAFSHRLLRDVVWDATPADVRRALHAAYAKVLLERGGETPGVLGHHLDLAGDAVRAVPLLGAAGDEAVRGFDDHGAAVMYRRALEAARRALAVDDDDARLADYLGASVKLADALRALGELAPARGVIDEGLARCDGAHRAHEAQLLRAQAHVTQAQGALDKAMATLRQAVGVAMATGNLELVAALYLDLATLHARRGDKAEARRELEEGIDVVTLGEGLPASGGPRVLWRMGARLAELLHGQGQRREAITAGLHALRHADRVEAALGRARVNSLLGFFHEQSGDLVAATRYRQAATDELRRLGDRRSTHELLASRQHTGQFRIDLDDLDLTRLDGDVGDDASEAVRR